LQTQSLVSGSSSYSYVLITLTILLTATAINPVTSAIDCDEFKIIGRLILYNVAPGIKDVKLTCDDVNCLEGMADVNRVMNCSANITDFSGFWSFNPYADDKGGGIKEVDLYGWFDEGNDAMYGDKANDEKLSDDFDSHMAYSGMAANTNFHFNFNTTTKKFSLIWPLTGEITLIESACGYRNVTIQFNTTISVIIWFVFVLGNQSRHAGGDGYWNPGPGFNDRFSWNFRIAAIDWAGYPGWRDYEFGVYRYTAGAVEVLYPTAVSGSPMERVHTQEFWILDVSNDRYNVNVTLASDLLLIAEPSIFIGSSNISFNCTKPHLQLGPVVNVTGGNSGWTGTFRPNIPPHRNNTYQITRNWRYEIYIPPGTKGGNYYVDLTYIIDQIP
jgi:hypothetical protein